MSTALETAYASATTTPLETYEIKHSSLSGGSVYLVKSKYDLVATLEDSSEVTFRAVAMQTSLPGKGGDGGQSQSISISNINGEAWASVKAIGDAIRTTPEEALCIYRPYLISDTSEPAGAAFELTIKDASVTRSAVTIQVAYTPLPDVTFPRTRYYSNRFPWLKYI